jgi:hypothetical protein
VVNQEASLPASEASMGLADPSAAGLVAEPPQRAKPFERTAYRIISWLRSPRPYLMLLGFALFFGFWYLSVEVWKLPRFSQMPGPTAVITEWVSPDPTYGLSAYSPEYYQHIWVSLRRFHSRDCHRSAARAFPRLVAKFQRIRVSGLRAAAPDPAAFMGAAGDHHV